jgi:antitoxin component YwqK of YwqJK toxin-antitoxin module
MKFRKSLIYHRLNNNKVIIKPLSITIIALLFVGICEAQNKVQFVYCDFSLNDLDSALFAFANTNSVGQGKQKVFLCNADSLKIGLLIVSLDHGVRNGESARYFIVNKHRRTIRELANYSSDRLYGSYTRFDRNGNKEIDGQYDKKGGKTGEWSFFKNKCLIAIRKYNDGSLVSEICYYPINGRIESMFIPDSTDRSKYYYIEKFNDTSNIISFIVHIKDKKICDWTFFDVEGNKHMYCKGIFNNDFPLFKGDHWEDTDLIPFDGIIEKYDKEGNLVEVYKYSNGYLKQD